ncbi:MAG: hypothetical protein Alpg2KO_06540 [Alphaproteobacteria bacterium]
MHDMRRRQNQTGTGLMPGGRQAREFDRLYRGRRYADWPGLAGAAEPPFDEVSSIMRNHGSLTGSAAAMCAALGDMEDGGKR